MSNDPAEQLNDTEQAAVQRAWRESRIVRLVPCTPTERDRAWAAELVRIVRDTHDGADAVELVANALWLRDLPVHPAFREDVKQNENRDG
jgi:hypothetical protein